MSIISPLDKDLTLIYKPLISNDFYDWLKAQGLSFVEVAEEENLNMACNVLTLGPRKLLMLGNLPLTKGRLEAAGCEVLIYKGDEISRKGEGGPTCLTRPLVRAVK
jgi:N-dimethylarginine dimethylaminohydrolase